MKVTRAGVDRSTDYLPDELTSISVVLVGWDGEAGQGTIPVPDPAGNQEPYEGEQLLLEQDSLTIVDGFLGAVTSERGSTVVGTRRVHTMTLGDDNALLQGHSTPGWVRPAEAPATRWAAFVTDFLPGSITTTWLLTTNESGITLPKKTYRTDSLFDDISADTIGPTGKTVYIEHRNFHWHLPTEGQTCSLSIHDTSYNGSTSFFPTSPTRQKDGMDLRNKLYARNDAGVEVSVSDATSITRHDSGGLKHEGYSEYGSETAAEMTRDLNVTLLERKAERVTWTYTIGPLTAAQAVELIPGSQMTVTVGVHGLSAAVKRIARVTLAYRHGARSGRFMATVELGYPRRVKRKPTKTSSSADSSGGSGVSGGGCDGCPPFNAGLGGCSAAELSHDLFDRVVSGGGATGWHGTGLTNTTTKRWRAANGGSSVTCDGADALNSWTGVGIGGSGVSQNWLANSASSNNSAKFRTAVHSGSVFHWKVENLRPANCPDTDSVGGGKAGWYWFVGTDGDTLTGSPASTRAYYLRIGSEGGWALYDTPNVGSAGLGNDTIVSSGSFASGDDVDVEVTNNGATITINGVAATLPAAMYEAFVEFDLAGAAGNTASQAIAALYELDTSICTEPTSGQDVMNDLATGDGSTTVFTTKFPFKPDAIHVLINGIDVTDSVASFDPATGTVTFTTAPGVGSEISFLYRAA